MTMLRTLRTMLPALSLAVAFRLAGVAAAQESGAPAAAAAGLGAAQVSEAPAVGAATEVRASGAKSAARPFNVFFVAVGQGDAEYIELPDGENALIDGGPNQKAIAAFLQSRGVTRINHVVLTHPHADHFRGLTHVFDHLQVDNFYDTKMDNTGTVQDDTLRGKAANKPGCVTHYPRPGERLNWGPGVSVKVFNSCPDAVASTRGDPEDDSGAQINNCSIVLKVATQDRSVLFPGDAQSEAEAREVAMFGDELKSDVLKVSHHGSRYSSTTEFLSRVRPQWAVIEVGKNNYGLPTDDAIYRLQQQGTLVYRTDQTGTIDGSTLAPQLMAKGGVSLAPVSELSALASGGPASAPTPGKP